MRISAAIGFALLLTACGGDENRTAAARQATSTERLHVRLSAIPDLRRVSGEITTVDQAVASARIAGILTELSVRAGDMVAKGQRIGTIVDSRLPHEAGAYAAQAAAAQAQADQAGAELARIRFLYDNGVYAKARLDQSQAAARTAHAQVAAARAQQASVAAVAGQGVLLAPTSGRVLTADVPAGSAVMPGTAIATVTAGAPVLRIAVPDSLADKIRVGTPVIAIGLTPEGGAAPRGRIVRLYPGVATGQMRADASVPGLGTTLVGRRVPVLLDVGARQAILVPRRFVTTAFGLDSVVVLDRAGQPASVPVQTAAASRPDMVEILSGISAGDTLALPGGSQ